MPVHTMIPTTELKETEVKKEQESTDNDQKMEGQEEEENKVTLIDFRKKNYIINGRGDFIRLELLAIPVVLVLLAIMFGFAVIGEGMGNTTRMELDYSRCKEDPASGRVWCIEDKVKLRDEVYSIKQRLESIEKKQQPFYNDYYSWECEDKNDPNTCDISPLITSSKYESIDMDLLLQQFNELAQVSKSLQTANNGMFLMLIFLFVWSVFSSIILCERRK